MLELRQQRLPPQPGVTWLAAWLVSCAGPAAQHDGLIEQPQPVLADRTLCGNGVIDPGELCDTQLPLGGECPEPWGLCWRCSTSCQARTVFVALGTPTPYCSLDNEPVLTERRYDLHGNLLAEWKTRQGALLERSQWLYDHRGRLLLGWKDSDNDGLPELEVRNTYGANGDRETLELRGERAWHPRAAGRSTPPSPAEAAALAANNPYPDSQRAVWSKHVHDAEGHLLSFALQHQPGTLQEELYEYTSSCPQYTHRYVPDRDRDGQLDYSIRYTLDPACVIIAATENSQQRGGAAWHYYYDHDVAGHLTRWWASVGNGTATVWEERHTYDNAGRLTLSWTDQNGDGRADYETRQAFDRFGNRLAWWVDSDGDGLPESSDLGRFDAAGRLVWRSVDADLAGHTGLLEQRCWRADGIDVARQWGNGLRCHEWLDLEERVVAQVCQQGEQGPWVDETTWRYDPIHGLPLAERRLITSGEPALRAYDYACLADVFETMPLVVPRNP